MTSIRKNDLKSWKDALPGAARYSHKYERGHGVFYGGADMTGAICLSSYSATRMGLGLATIVAPEKSVDIYRQFKPHIIVRPAGSEQEKIKFAKADNVNTIVIGPGYGQDKNLKRLTLDLLSLKKSYVLDADALTCFESDRQEFFTSLTDHCVLTPHSGEFKKLFGNYDDKVAATIQAAIETGAVIVHKGQDTVIAAPNGRCVLQEGSPHLATAGSGDVLTGFVAGLIGQGVPMFEAACAAVWMHVKCAENFGRGLTATDLPEMLPDILQGIS